MGNETGYTTESVECVGAAEMMRTLPWKRRINKCVANRLTNRRIDIVNHWVAYTEQKFELCLQTRKHLDLIWIQYRYLLLKFESVWKPTLHLISGMNLLNMFYQNKTRLCKAGSLSVRLRSIYQSKEYSWLYIAKYYKQYYKFESS